MSICSCKFEKLNGVFSCDCGTALRQVDGVEWVSLCNPGALKIPCKHRGEETGRVHYIAGKSSSLEEVEHTCQHPEIPGTCVTTASADDQATICRKCRNYEPQEINISDLYADRFGAPGNERPAGLMDCQHLGQATSEQVEVTGCGGCKTAKGMTTVFECDLHDHCTPLGKAKHDGSLKACGECKDYEQA